MLIKVNGQDREISEKASVSDLLGELGILGPVAVELNQTVCPKRLHAQTRLNPGDILEIVTIVGGG